MSSPSRPEHVGILAMEVYTPHRYVSQADLEVTDNCAGKYTVGLGQLNMAFTDDREDIGSIFLNATANLLEKYSIPPNDIGRLEVGTETLTDKSKSVKTTLMRLFAENTDMEGITTVNACYGGTAAVFNSIAWIESSEWNGKFALVVCGDIAVYDVGPARPTGGCGAFAILIGPNAPLALEPGVRATHMMDVYDFYKPHHSEYAAVDGKLSQWAYLSSVETCYGRYKAKYAAKHPDKPPVTQNHFDFFAFHSPYNKLVQKGFTRIFYSDFLSNPADPALASLSPFAGMPLEESYESRDLETSLRALSTERFKSAVMPCCIFNQNVGNCYTGSIFGGLISLLCTEGESLLGKRIMVFSYGSGSAASIYSFIGRETSSPFSLKRVKDTVGIFDR